MNFKEIVEKEIIRIMAENRAPEDLWYLAKSRVRTKSVPDEVVERSGVTSVSRYGAISRYVAIKYLPQGKTYKDVWGREMDRDECIVESDAKDQVVEFYMLDDEEITTFLKEISKYIELDVDSFKGCPLGAYYPLYAKDNSGNTVWDEYVREFEWEGEAE